MTADPEKFRTERISIDYARSWVGTKVSSKRFAHIEGVAATAVRLARYAHCDLYLAELAGWLHDACKENSEKELLKQAKAFGLILDPFEEDNGHLLHGPVAAAVVQHTLGVNNPEVLSAISEHTLGAAPMSLVSKVVFLADALEPGRPKSYTEPIWKALGCAIDDPKLPESNTDKDYPDLDLAVLVTCELNLRYLLDDQRAIHPKTVAVRNYYLKLISQRR